MKVARQFIAWYRCENGNRPVGYGMIGSDRRATIRTINQPGVGIRPCPTGRILDWTRFQAINCLATIISPFGTTNRQYLSTFSNPHHSAHTESRTRTACPTKLYLPRLAALLASEVGTTRTRTKRLVRGATLIPRG